MFRLLLACPPHGLDRSSNALVAPLKDVMTSDGLGAADRHED